jgi:hypothetical protein
MHVEKLAKCFPLALLTLQDDLIVGLHPITPFNK